MKNMRLINRKITLNSSIIVIISITLCLFSCIPQKKVRYLQSKSETDTLLSFALKQKEPNLIRPFDELYVEVKSIDEQQYNIFNDINSRSSMTSTMTNLISYTVFEDGTIDLPYLGKVYVQGMTVREAAINLEVQLKEYLNEPTVKIKFINKHVTLVGEITRPGKYDISNEQLNVFQALSLAGDVTDFANTKKIAIIREENEKTNIHYIDLTDKNIITSEYYYIQHNDVIYVQALNVKSWGINNNPIQLTLSAISTFILLYTFIKNL